MASSTSRSPADLAVEAVAVPEAAAVELVAETETDAEAKVRAKLRPLPQPRGFLQDCWCTRSTARPLCLRPRLRRNNEA